MSRAGTLGYLLFINGLKVGLNEILGKGVFGEGGAVDCRDPGTIDQ